jgi:hypothetical protein
MRRTNYFFGSTVIYIHGFVTINKQFHYLSRPCNVFLKRYTKIGSFASKSDIFILWVWRSSAFTMRAVETWRGLQEPLPCST